MPKVPGVNHLDAVRGLEKARIAVTPRWSRARTRRPPSRRGGAVDGGPAPGRSPLRAFLISSRRMPRCRSATPTPYVEGQAAGAREVGAADSDRQECPSRGAD